MLNKRDPHIPPIGTRKRGDNHSSPKEETVPLRVGIPPEGQSIQPSQEKASPEGLEPEPPSRRVEG